jgi:hypothetical protein
VGIRCAYHATVQRLALTSPTSGGRSVAIVRLQTTATEFGCKVMRRTENEYSDFILLMQFFESVLLVTGV